MNTELLLKLSLVIPTYNRKSYALRNMHFWSNRFANVYIMDGSDFPISDSELSQFGSNIHYYHLPISIEERLTFAAELVESEYAMLCGDDEYMLPSGLLECIKFLETNPDYSSVCGRSIGFEYQDGELRLRLVKPYHKNHFVNQDSMSARIEYHIKNFMVTTIYGVHRKDSFKYCLKWGSGKKCSCAYVGETLFELFSAAYGKSKVLNNVSWLRSFENKPISISGFDRRYSISEWYDDPMMVDEVDNLYLHVRQAVLSLCNKKEHDPVWKAVRSGLKVRFASDRASGNVALSTNLTIFSFVRTFISNSVFLSWIKSLIKNVLFKGNVIKTGKYPDYYKSSRDNFYAVIKNDSSIVLDEDEVSAIFDDILLFHSTKI